MAIGNGSIAVPSFITAVYDDSPIPTSIYDRDGTQVAFNAAHGKMWNMRPEDSLGRFNMVTDPQLAASQVENNIWPVATFNWTNDRQNLSTAAPVLVTNSTIP